MLDHMAELADVAEGQWGYVTSAQAAALNIPADTLHDLTEARILEPVIEGVIRLRGGHRHAFP